MKRSNVAVASLLLGLAGLGLICVIPSLGGFLSSSKNNFFSNGGIVALLCGPVFGLLLALAAVITGFIGVAQTRKGEMAGRGLAIFGILLGAAPYALMAAAICTLLFVGGPIANAISTAIATFAP